MVSSFRQPIEKTKQTQRMREHGFTLVEVALILLVMGLFIGAVISFAEFEDDQLALRETQMRQKRIAVAISDFANRNGYVPCPAHYYPSAAPSDGDFGYARAVCNTIDDRVGIVPYMTLGLSSKDIVDGYGNYMSFVVFEPAANARTATTAHFYCRTPVWIPAGVNINPPKARFCCGRDTSSGEMVYSDISQSAWPSSGLQVNVSSTIMSAGDWANVNTQFAGPLPAYKMPLTYFAYNLISHGKNGSYAPLANDSMSGAMGAVQRVATKGPQQASRFDDPANAGTPSAANIRAFFRAVRPMNLTAGPEYYDNIVLWRTQEQVIAETGISDCSTP